MKNSCIKTRELFNEYKNGSLKDAERVNEAREHVRFVIHAGTLRLRIVFLIF